MPKLSEKLSDRQRQCLQVIVEFYGNHGYPPTFRDIGRAMDIKSPNGVLCNLRPLFKRGYLCVQKFSGKSRAIVPVFLFDAIRERCTEWLGGEVKEGHLQKKPLK